MPNQVTAVAIRVLKSLASREAPAQEDMALLCEWVAPEYRDLEPVALARQVLQDEVLRRKKAKAPGASAGQ